LGDGLPIPNRQRAVIIRRPHLPPRDKLVPWNLPKRIQEARFTQASALDLLRDHFLAFFPVCVQIIRFLVHCENLPAAAA
jgi:hypothetical protein